MNETAAVMPLVCGIQFHGVYDQTILTSYQRFSHMLNHFFYNNGLNKSELRELAPVVIQHHHHGPGPKISQNVNYTHRGTMEGPKAPSEARRREAPECRGGWVWGGAP